jgi:signal transduction histidine kinase
LIGFSKELYSLFSDKAARNEIVFVFETTLDECPVWADKEKLEIIVFNLLSNAFKFTPKNGRIRFAVGMNKSLKSFPDGAVEIHISDTGFGIDREELSRIFERSIMVNVQIIYFTSSVYTFEMQPQTIDLFFIIQWKLYNYFMI